MNKILLQTKLLAMPQSESGKLARKTKTCELKLIKMLKFAVLKKALNLFLPFCSNLEPGMIMVAGRRF